MSETHPSSKVTGVGVLDRVVAILDAVERRPRKSSELARHLGLSVPTTHRLVLALVHHGFLRRDEQGRNYLGQRFTSSHLAGIATPILEELRRDSDETTQLWVRRGDQRLCLVSFESTAELRASLPAGSLLPLSERGSAAHALTADEPLDPAHPQRRWFESVSQRTPGLGSVSAAVRADGETIAAVCVSAPLTRIPGGSPGVAYGAMVVEAAERIQASVTSS